MKITTPHIFLVTTLLFFGLASVNKTTAQETFIVGQVETIQTVRFTNENWFTLPHPMIATFTVEKNGNMFGLTETGVSFKQYNVPNDVGIRIQRFEIDDHYHYIVNGMPVYSFEELSVELSNAYNASNV